MIFYVSIWPSTKQFFLLLHNFYSLLLPTLIKHWAFIVNLKDHHFIFFSLFLFFSVFFPWTLNLIRRLFHSTPKSFSFFIVFSCFSANGMGLWHYTRCKGGKTFWWGRIMPSWTASAIKTQILVGLDKRI